MFAQYIDVHYLMVNRLWELISTRILIHWYNTMYIIHWLIIHKLNCYRLSRFRLISRNDSQLCPQKLEVQLDLHSHFNGIDQSGTLLSQAEYSKGNRVFVVHPPESDGLAVEGHFDGVSNERFIGYIVRESSGERCAELRFVKQA